MVIRSLNPFNYRAGTEPNAKTGPIPVSSLNPFNYRAGTEHMLAEIMKPTNNGLNPFNYRAGTEPGIEKALAGGKGGLNPFNYRAGTEPWTTHSLPQNMVSIPSTTGLVLNVPLDAVIEKLRVSIPSTTGLVLNTVRCVVCKRTVPSQSLQLQGWY